MESKTETYRVLNLYVTLYVFNMLHNYWKTQLGEAALMCVINSQHGHSCSNTSNQKCVFWVKHDFSFHSLFLFCTKTLFSINLISAKVSFPFHVNINIFFQSPYIPGMPY